MSKRRCISLLLTPSQSQTSRQPCIYAADRSLLRHETAQHQHPRHPHHRPFSSTTTRRNVGARRGVNVRQKTGPSMAVQMKAQQASAVKDGSILEHIGLLDGVFVPPTDANLPSWFSNWRDRLRIQKESLKNLFYSHIHSRIMSWWFIRPRPKLEIGKTPRIASELYKEMYTQFAKGDLSGMEQKLSPGLLGSLRARIAERAPNTSLRWMLHRFIGRPRCVAYRVGIMDPKAPKTEHLGVIQAVVRIRALQSLMRVQRKRVPNPQTGQMEIQEMVTDAVGNEVPRDLKRLGDMLMQTAKVKTEYLVIQRYIKRSKAGPWHVWGETSETTLEKIKRAEALRARHVAQPTSRA